MKKKLIFCCFVSLALKGVHLVPRVSHLTAPWGGNMRDPGNELELRAIELFSGIPSKENETRWRTKVSWLKFRVSTIVCNQMS